MSEVIKDYGEMELPGCVELIEKNPEFFIISGPIEGKEDEMLTAMRGDMASVLTMIYGMLERLDTSDLVRLLGRATRELVLPHTTMGRSDNLRVKDPEEEDVNKQAREEILQKLVDDGDMTEGQRDEIRKAIGDVS